MSRNTSKIVSSFKTENSQQIHTKPVMFSMTVGCNRWCIFKCIELIGMTWLVTSMLFGVGGISLPIQSLSVIIGLARVNPWQITEIQSTYISCWMWTFRCCVVYYDWACGSPAHLNLHCSSNTDTYRLCQKKYSVMYSVINWGSLLMWNGSRVILDYIISMYRVSIWHGGSNLVTWNAV